MRKFALAAGVVGASLTSLPTLLAAQATSPVLAPQAIRSHVEFLADDLLEGRGTGTRGFDLAARYVAAQFRAAGFEPAVNDQWYQQVPLVERTPVVSPGAHLSIGDAIFPLGEQAVAVISGEGDQHWSGEAVFGGYGMAEPAAGTEDWAGLDLRGKALVLLEAAPSVLSPERARLLMERRIERAGERGAAGVILVPTAPLNEADWSALRADFAMPFFNWLQADGTPFRHRAMRFSATLQPDAAARLFTGSAHQLSQLQALAARGDPLPAFALTQRVTVETGNSWRRFASPNVIGMVRGRGAGLAGECVLVTSHLDHLGSDPSAPGEDKIFNGALDNASGVATLIEVARAVATSPGRPQRSVVFAAVTGEEIGLLGSDYLAAHPLEGCERIVAVVNLDGGVPLHRLSEASAYGGWHSTLGAVFDRVAANNGIRPVPEELPATEFFTRTDHYSFARRGIPAIYLVMGGGDEQGAAYRGRYHQPGDDLTLPFDWEAGAQFARLAYDLIMELTDAPDAPHWYADSTFAQRYASGQPLIARPLE